jgi:hypothetical protein
MSTYTIPQDVETEDKILGPFGFRQFIYLLICVVLIAAAYGLFLLVPVLVILPVPGIFFFLIIALPLKKEQPMETYMGALIRFYFKPQRRLWIADGQESFVKIEEGVVVDEPELKDFNGDEAERRISFLSDIVDSHGWKTRGINQPVTTGTSVNDDMQIEASEIIDMFDTQHSAAIGSELVESSQNYKKALMSQMQNNYQHEMALEEQQNSGIIRGES